MVTGAASEALFQVVGQGESPGRLDFMGGVADYSGSMVLEMPIKGKTRVTLRLATEPVVVCQSAGFDAYHFPSTVWHQLLTQYVTHYSTSEPSRTQEHAFLATVQKHFQDLSVPSWCRYVIGCVTVYCIKKYWVPPLPGMRASVSSEVNASMGVSSSAAIEIATLRAVAALAQHATLATTGRANDALSFIGTELAHYGQLAENRIVGAPCGLMDQLSVAYGKSDHLLPILCRPDILYDNIKMPEGITVIGWPSGIKHSVGESPYSMARAGAFMGKKMMEQLTGQSVKFTAEFTPASLLAPIKPLPLSHEKSAHLPAVHPAHHLSYESRLSALPVSMLGSDFLTTYRGVDDPLSVIKPELHYPVRDAFNFPIQESFRCQTVAALLSSLNSKLAATTSSSVSSRASVLHTIGELLYQSHRGYSLMGLGCPETDAIIAILQSMRESGVYGGRISGGGSGGTVIVLCETSAVPLVRAQVKAFVSSASLDIIQA